MSTNFDIKKFLIKEGMTRVSRDRKRLLEESDGQNTEGQVNQEALQMAKEIASGQRDGYVFLIDDQTMRDRVLPERDEEATWNRFREVLKDINDGIWICLPNEECIAVMEYEWWNQDDNNSLTKKRNRVWQELTKISRDGDKTSGGKGYSPEELDGEWMNTGAWVKVQGGQVTYYLDNPFKNPKAKKYQDDEDLQISVTNENIPDGWYVVLDDDGFSQLSGKISSTYNTTSEKGPWDYERHWIRLREQ